MEVVGGGGESSPGGGGRGRTRRRPSSPLTPPTPGQAAELPSGASDGPPVALLSSSRFASDTAALRDEVDRLPNRCHVTNWDILVLLISILSHMIDVALDINLAYRYYKDKRTTYCSLTVLFIMFPAFVNTFISVRMSLRSPGEQVVRPRTPSTIRRILSRDPLIFKTGTSSYGAAFKSGYVLSDDEMVSSSRMAVKKWAIRIFVLLFQLAPVMRYCDSLDYALKSRAAERQNNLADQRRYYELMLKEDSDVALLRVFECYLEAAPQQILQVTIVLIESTRPKLYQLLHQSGSIASSLLSMAWSMASYHRSIRLCQMDKSNLSISGTIMQFLWHFNVTVSRILSIAAFASVTPIWTSVACFLHTALMSFWLALSEQTHFTIDRGSSFRAKLSEFVFCCILGLVYIFTYLTPSQGSTRNRYLVYYPVCFIENLLAITAWALLTNQDIKSSWYFVPYIVMSIVPFLTGIGFMILYYLYFHPETSRRIKRDKKETSTQMIVT